MDRASFELIGNVGKLEIKPLKGDRHLAVVSLATSERWKTESGDGQEKTYWHRVAVFAPAKVALIEKAVQVGTRLRLVGQIRPGSWDDERGQTRYSIEFVVTGLGDVEILARGRPKAEDQSEPALVGEDAPKAKRRKAA
jgi:single-strand DNA-binding protein